MKLFKVLLTHVATKDHQTAIKEYVIANTHGDVFNYLYEKAGYTWWNEREWDDSIKNVVLFGHGESALDSDWADAYYGITEYDWEQVRNSLSQDEIDTLVELEIAKVV
jgi:hypothetical protein